MRCKRILYFDHCEDFEGTTRDKETTLASLSTSQRTGTDLRRIQNGQLQRSTTRNSCQNRDPYGQLLLLSRPH